VAAVALVVVLVIWCGGGEHVCGEYQVFVFLASFLLYLCGFWCWKSLKQRQ
jgi:hypothetical protein